MMIGTVTTTAAAAIDPVGCWNCDAPGNCEIAAGHRLRRVDVDVSETANTKSFQAKMKTRIAVGEHAGRRERGDDLRERLPRRRAVDLRRLLELPRYLSEERRQRVDRQRKRERHVRDDQPGPRVEQAQVAPHVVERADDRDRREHRDRRAPS